MGKERNKPQTKTKKKRIQKISETKHIAKNYGRAILRFAIKNKDLVKRLMKKEIRNYGNFVRFCKKTKRQLQTITELRSLWIDE